MKKFSVSALCCVAACALCLGGCNKNSETAGECADKASCAEKSECSKGKSVDGCCKSKKAAELN